MSDLDDFSDVFTDASDTPPPRGRGPPSSASELSSVFSSDDEDDDASFYAGSALARPVYGGKQPRAQHNVVGTPKQPPTDYDTFDDEDDEGTIPGGGGQAAALDLDDSDDYDEDAPPVKAKKRGRAKGTITTPARRRSWGVPHDPVPIPMATKQLEKILSYKPATDETPEKFLVKYKHSSYLHTEWVGRAFIENEHLGKHRLKKFIAQQAAAANAWNDESFNPAYLQVDRVLDEGELPDPQTGEPVVYVLVKWCGQPYDEATWELLEEVRGLDAERLADFHARRLPPDPHRSHTRLCPPPTAFQQLTTSPAFKYGNQLRPYQLEGLNWLLFCWFNRRSCMMADEMGLGKTVQSVSFLYQVHRAHGIHGPFLVVAPLSTVPHWEREFLNWTNLNVLVYHGGATARDLIVGTEFYYKDAAGRTIPHLYKFDVIITTYEMVTAGAPHLRPIPWRIAVFDEAHRLKNKASKVLDTLRGYSFEFRLLLTGTPLQNAVSELFCLLHFIQPEVFSDEQAFLATYGSLTTKEEVDRIQALLKPLMLRRFKEDVEKSIPVKEETVVEVELTAYQKKFYRAILERNFAWLSTGAKGAAGGPSLINIVVELRKCCMHPFLITGAEERIAREVQPATPQAYLDMLIASSGKLVLIDKLLRRLKEGNHKVLIFSQMTRCLDILADYLAARRYNYERIDGSIKGEQRQAAIDRFSTDPQAFVFLLCTRAGGVGINLTAADTCVIYDSDWNPQNDLQAQARCHRIGQTKPVKIYRLLTRNTYEKEMFDKAGMKLGLDRAVLQKMDVQSALRSSDDSAALGGAGLGGSRAPSALSKKEVEELLKKGAYGALMDDDGASAKFCEEDIDQILERRTTVIRHDANEPGSVFSKASFSAAPTAGDDVDINDPEFWTKWAAKADIQVPGTGLADPLILDAPRRRQRRAAQRYQDPDHAPGPDPDVDADLGSSDSEADAEFGRRRNPPARAWTAAEKTRLERKLMVWGYGKWEELQAHLPKRQPADLHAVVRCLVIYSLQLTDIKSAEDRELLADLRVMSELAGDPITDAELVPGLGNIRQIPYPQANKRQTTEYRSFLLDAPGEYLDHIRKKGRNLLLRLQLMYTIRSRIVPEDWNEARRMIIPKVTGSQPAPWWGTGEDRDLLLGIYKYGYQQYDRLLTDPDLHFHEHHFINAPQPDEEDAAAAGGTGGDNGTPARRAATPMATTASGHTGPGLIWPTKAEIGQRLRRIISAIQRRQTADAKRAAKYGGDESPTSDAFSPDASHRLGKSRSHPATFGDGGRSSHGGKRLFASPVRGGALVTSPTTVERWTKREQGEFYKTLSSFGVETTDELPVRIVWDRFRDLSGLHRKDDAALEVCLRALLDRCTVFAEDQNEPIDVDELLPGIAYHALGAQPHGADLDPVRDPNLYDETILTREKARRLLRRIHLLNEVRDVVRYPHLTAALAGARWFNYLPEWWVPAGEHDEGLLRGVALYGIARGDLLCNDPDLPFKDAVMAATTANGGGGGGASTVTGTREGGPLSASETEDAAGGELDDVEVGTGAEDHLSETEDGDTPTVVATNGHAATAASIGSTLTPATPRNGSTAAPHGQAVLREAVAVRRLEYLCKQAKKYMFKHPVPMDVRAVNALTAIRRSRSGVPTSGGGGGGGTGSTPVRRSGIKLTLKLGGARPSVSASPASAVGSNSSDQQRFPPLGGKHPIVPASSTTPRSRKQQRLTIGPGSSSPLYGHTDDDDEDGEGAEPDVFLPSDDDNDGVGTTSTRALPSVPPPARRGVPPPRSRSRPGTTTTTTTTAVSSTASTRQSSPSTLGGKGVAAPPPPARRAPSKNESRNRAPIALAVSRSAVLAASAADHGNSGGVNGKRRLGDDDDVATASPSKRATYE
ncbi:hypothetical protein IWQ60_004528 [Tieghemiomyces parasiticus]|uniref:Uncharacterized protein n=1 Tax=Tieghemiomyces parasiticus TaxID=78921 RepID=A0A9W8ADH6_9FUNG|nr:hypothetical protein IWQ60_004528 [Tieghemiomyces parasiticus]